MPTKKKVTPKKKAAPAKKKPAAKKEETSQRMRFVKVTKKGETVTEGVLIRKLLYKGQEYFLIKTDSGKTQYMNAKYWEGEA